MPNENFEFEFYLTCQPLRCPNTFLHSFLLIKASPACYDAGYCILGAPPPRMSDSSTRIKLGGEEVGGNSLLLGLVLLLVLQVLLLLQLVPQVSKD